LRRRVSVVMGVFNGADALEETLASVAAQTLDDFECIVVDDGSTDARVGALLASWKQRDRRFRVIRREKQGLTRALIAGCAKARGEFIARVDVGDTMAPGRLADQEAVLREYPDCVFVSAWTQFHGPRWEPLWVNPGRGPEERPASILPEDARQGLTGDIPHHGSVMFRRSAYERVRGYRAAFYFGQDWDLWYRLAEVGTFWVVSRVLYHARFFPEGISISHAARQRYIAECSHGAFVARRNGRDEQPWLERAAAIRPEAARPVARSLEPGFYFIGEALRRRGNPACRQYLAAALRERPGSVRAWVRLTQSMWLPRRFAAEEATG
jgi:glycosyltransferase involved in cell wall biosynthesis